MRLEEKVLYAKNNEEALNFLIQDYKNYIMSSASKVVKRQITEHDDEMSIALMAFNEAVKKYDFDKGSFLNYSNLIIKNRLIDYIRKEAKNKTIDFSSLYNVDKEGNESEFEVSDSKQLFNDVKYEIEALTFELKKYDISFLELSKVSPKSRKTRHACFQVIKLLTRDKMIVSEIKKSGILPIKAVLESLQLNRKIIERHRKYILAGIIILTGEYGNVAEYFAGVKEV